MLEDTSKLILRSLKYIYSKVIVKCKCKKYSRVKSKCSGSIFSKWSSTRIDILKIQPNKMLKMKKDTTKFGVYFIFI